MATMEQVKSLIRSHVSDQQEQFRVTALQVAAHEAVLGHSAIAHEIRNLIDSKPAVRRPKVVPYTPDFENLVVRVDETIYRNAIVLNESVRGALDRIVAEYRGRTALEQYGLQYRRKILLVGPPGTGKTMTASVLATALQLPLYRVCLDKIITKYMGETSAKLRLLFESMHERKGLYFFDEFDAIGSSRSDDNDVGEMRRVINSFLQFIEQDPSDSVILAATNNPRLLDAAMFRRFDDVLAYALPDVREIRRLYEDTLSRFARPETVSVDLVSDSLTLSQAEIVRVCKDAMKEVVLKGRKEVCEVRLRELVAVRKRSRLRSFQEA